jgi:hypothetical protein
MNVTYDPDDFAFTIVLSINNRVLYKNTLSGKYLRRGFGSRVLFPVEKLTKTQIVA